MAKAKTSSNVKKIVIAILITFGLLIIFRLGAFITLPFINHDVIGSSAQQQSALIDFGFLDVFTGGALSSYSILCLGISPYITASIVTQLLQMDIVPKLKEWADEGEKGREKINTLNRYLALGMGFVQALTIVIGISVSYNGAFFGPGTPVNAMTYIYLAIVMTAGTAFTLWLAEKITKHGVGNGTSMIIVAGIVSTFPDMINTLIQTYISGSDKKTSDLFIFIGVVVLLLVIIVGVVFMEGAQRKIPINYSNRPKAAMFRGKNESNIPIKLNSASVIPVIFASTLMSLPMAVANFLPAGGAKTWITNICSTSEPIGFALYIVLIFVFAFFYSFLQMDPEKMAENLHKQNANIPGINPGPETASYISRLLFKVTMLGATYLAILAALPIVVVKIFDLPQSVQIGGTSLIIVVGVALETAKQIKETSETGKYSGSSYWLD